MYFSAEQVSVSFKRLSSRRRDGKTHLERTSGLFYFLAFDAVCKKFDRCRLDLNPDRSEGRDNRKSVELEFTKLVLLERLPDSIRQVAELGKVDSSGKDPEKRISSNFLTVPLKKASEQTNPYFYPRRPAPLIRLGQAATGIKWGIEYHLNWPENLPKFMSEIKDPTPFTDLAIFVFRDTTFSDDTKDYLGALSCAIKDRFSSQLADFWIARIDREKIMAKHIVFPFSDSHSPFEKSLRKSSPRRFEGASANKLIDYIGYLERTLETNGVEFEHRN